MSNAILFGLPPLVTAFTTLIFSIIGFTRKPQSRINKVFSYLCLSVSLWATGYGLLYLLQPSESLLLPRLGYIGVVFIPTLTFHFITLFVQRDYRRTIHLLYLLSTGFLIVSQLSVFMESYYQYFWGPYPKAGPAYAFFVAFFAGIFFWCVLLLYGYFKSDGGANAVIYNQTKFVFFAFAVASTSVVDYIPNYGHEIYPFGYLSAFGWISLIAYATLRFRLMDFNLLLRWGLAYTTTIGFTSAAFLIAALIFERLLSNSGAATGLPTIIAASVAVLTFDSMRKKIAKGVDQLIFKSPDFDIKLRGLREHMSKADSLEAVASGVIPYIKEFWNIAHGGFCTWDSATSSFKVLPRRAFADLQVSKVDFRVDQSDYLVKTLESERRLFKGGIVTDYDLIAMSAIAYPGEKTTFSKIRRTMRWLGASACVPLMYESTLIGFIVLGEKRNRSLFNNEDKKIMLHVAELLTVSILHHIRVNQKKKTDLVADVKK